MRCNRVEIDRVKDLYIDYYYGINGGFDDFFEEKILDGKHHIILNEGEEIGAFSISKEDELLLLHLVPEKRNLYEKVFEELISFEKIRGIVTISNDTNMMMQILRRNFRIKKEGCNFEYINGNIQSKLEIRQALMEQAAKLEGLFGDFLDNYENEIKKGTVFLGYDNGEIVSLGLMERHKLILHTVSIGMIVAESKRNRGYGVETIRGLIVLARERGLNVKAGCWFYNHWSKKTLIKAGMTQINYIIKVDEF